MVRGTRTRWLHAPDTASRQIWARLSISDDIWWFLVWDALVDYLRHDDIMGRRRAAAHISPPRMPEHMLLLPLPWALRLKHYQGLSLETFRHIDSVQHYVASVPRLAQIITMRATPSAYWELATLIEGRASIIGASWGRFASRPVYDYAIAQWGDIYAVTADFAVAYRAFYWKSGIAAGVDKSRSQLYSELLQNNSRQPA